MVCTNRLTGSASPASFELNTVGFLPIGTGVAAVRRMDGGHNGTAF